MTAPDSSAAAAPPTGPLWTRPWFLLGGLTLLVHLLANGHYGIFRDELYIIACGEHPAFGYVDQPPLVPLVAGASYALFGPALIPLRLAPMLSMTATVALTCEVTRTLGGGRFAQWLAGLCIVTGSVFLVNGMLLTTDTFQPITWLGASWCLIRLMQTRDERWWLAFGAVVGVSFESKYLIAFFLVGLAAGVLATDLRRSLARPWLYVGAGIAVVLGAPSVIWQQQHGWPFLELGRAGMNGKNLQLSILGYLGQQFLFAGPLTAPVWLAGLWRFSVRPPLPALRVFPIAWVIAGLMFQALHGKAYYLTPIYPVLFAGGALAIEAWLRSGAGRAAVLAAISVAGIALAPFAIPVLPVPAYIAYASALGLSERLAATENRKLGLLPQQFADMRGWPQMAAKVAAVYQALPPADRARAVFFGFNYGEAGAIDVLGRPLGLPPAISGHNNYYLWGPQGRDGSVVIVLGGDLKKLQELYGDVQVAGRIDTAYAMPYETNLPIYVLRRPKVSLAALWPTLKHYE